MNTTAPIVEPKLDVPGAGLPWLELKIANYGFHFLNRRTTRERSSAQLKRACSAILEQVRSCRADEGSIRVLIKRLPGMEDSSRYWSVFMTLDHLRIVNMAVADTIRLLGESQVPGRRADTAAVKPSPAADASVVHDFELSNRVIERCAAHVADLKTEARYDHPWFGPLDAAGWYFLAGFHQELHRKQIARIIRQLPRPASR